MRPQDLGKMASEDPWWMPVLAIIMVIPTLWVLNWIVERPKVYWSLMAFLVLIHIPLRFCGRKKKKK